MVVWRPDQSVNDPGVPQDVFNFLANYQFDFGLGLRLGAQVTGPIATSSSGFIDIAATNAAALGSGLPTLLGPGGVVPASIVDARGYFKSPQIPWQYTLNAAVYYDWGPYEVKLGAYNLTDQRNFQSSIPFYGNDFLVQSDPVSVDLTFKTKF